VSRWWGWWKPVDSKPTRQELQQDLQATADRLAAAHAGLEWRERQLAAARRQLGEAQRQIEQLKTANEGVHIELRREKGRRLDAQVRQAAAEKAAKDLSERQERARAILTDRNSLAAEANRLALQVLEGGNGD
jgi:chromosome segregation ATPase